MWLAFRLTVAAVAFFIRLVLARVPWRWRGGETVKVGNESYVVIKHRAKRGVVATSFGVSFPCKFIFKLGSESAVDRFFKSLGLAKEIQTGDRQFDEKVYVVSDNPAVARELSSDSETRRLILELMTYAGAKLTCDGRMLWLKVDRDQSANQELLNTFALLSKQMADLSRVPGTWRDPYIWRAFMIEALIWTVAAYAFSGFFEWLIHDEDYHVNSAAVIKEGLVAGSIGLVLLMGAIIAFMRGSSRGHRIIVESVIVLAVSFPYGGIHLVSDINRQLDISTSVWVERTIVSKKRVKHRSRRSTNYTYHLQLKASANSDSVNIPPEIQVRYGLFNRAASGSTLSIELGEGWLHHLWYRSMQMK